MKLLTEVLTFENKKKLTVSQSNWDISMTLEEEQRKALENPNEDKRLQYFREKIYPVIFSPSSGNVPGLEEAYRMIENAPGDLDKWYLAVQKLNPEWFTWHNHNLTEEIVFSDKSKLLVVDGNVPTGIMRIRDLEEYAQENPLDDLKKQVFRMQFYPKLAGCSLGDVPDEETARTMPTAEINRWYEAVNRVNPHWFAGLLELSKEAQAAQLKKKAKRPRK